MSKYTERKRLTLGDLDLFRTDVLLHPLLGFFQNSSDAEQTDQDGKQGKAFLQIGFHEGHHEARLAIAAVRDVEGANKAQPDTQHATEDTEQHIVRQRGDDGERQKNDQELFDVGELDGKVSQHRREQEQHEEADEASKQRRHNADLERPLALALLRHRVAVKGCRDRRGRTWDIEKDGWHQAAGDTADVKAQQKREAVIKVERVGQWQADCNSHGGSHTRNGAEQDADEHAGGA